MKFKSKDFILLVVISMVGYAVAKKFNLFGANGINIMPTIPSMPNTSGGINEAGGNWGVA